MDQKYLIYTSFKRSGIQKMVSNIRELGSVQNTKKREHLRSRCSPPKRMKMRAFVSAGVMCGAAAFVVPAAPALRSSALAAPAAVGFARCVMLFSVGQMCICHHDMSTLAHTQQTHTRACAHSRTLSLTHTHTHNIYYITLYTFMNFMHFVII